MAALLQALNLHKRFGSVVAARDLNIEIAEGEKLSLIGSNGAGKTTFVNMCTGFVAPDEGQILLQGQNITSVSPRLLAARGISRSFQIPQLFLELTVQENLLVAVTASAPGSPSPARCAASGPALERVFELLDRFALSPMAWQRASQLPGGARKLLDICMALARTPHLLLLDEPTAAVSAQEKFQTMERILQAASQERSTIVFVEHDMEIVERFSERVIAFVAGSVIADGPPSKVLASPDVKRHITGGLV